MWTSSLFRQLLFVGLVLSLPACAIRNIGEIQTPPPLTATPAPSPIPTPALVDCDNTVALDTYIQAAGSAVVVVRPIIRGLAGATPLDAREQLATVREQRDRVNSIDRVPECAVTAHRLIVDTLNNTADTLTGYANNDLDTINILEIMDEFDAIDVQLNDLRDRRNDQMTD